MWKVIFPVIVFIFAASYLVAVDGLKCYHCYHDERLNSSHGRRFGDGLAFDKSCKNGSVPDKKFTRTCEAYRHFGTTIQPTCGRIYTTGRLFNNTNYQMTIRGCYHNFTALPRDNCTRFSDTYGLIHATVGPMKQALDDMIGQGYINGGSSASFCHCKNKDNCNGAGGLGLSLTLAGFVGTFLLVSK